MFVLRFCLHLAVRQATFQYTDPGGQIVVNVERTGDEAAITVRDNGIGIAPELMPQLFEMFFQADSSLDHAGGGLGIGLNVAKRLVELHGGRIAAHSKGLGQGSEFTMHLPVTSEAESQPEPRRREITPPLPAVSISHKVLIVDDNRDMAEATAELATLCGHQVATAQDGPTALELASTFRPDIALIDIGLPQMDGYELARRLRKLPGMERVLLVAMTGYSREQDRRASREAGFALHLVKPVKSERLEALLATVTEVGEQS